MTNPNGLIQADCVVTDGRNQNYGIHGSFDPRFTAVYDAFKENFVRGEENGASVCVHHEGRNVADLWGGWRDAENAQAWDRDTTVNMMSVAKGFVAVSVAMLVERGLLDYDEPVATWWPEFAANGKSKIPLRYILDHRAGLPVLKPSGERGSIYDWDKTVESYAKMAPLWEPGSKAGYHILSMGFLCGEVIRRVTGQTPGEFVRREICEPLKLNYALGVEGDEMPSMATFLPALEGTIFKVDELSDEDLLKFAWAELPEEEDYNSPAWRAAQIPGASGHGHARAVSRFYACLAEGGTLDGVTLLKPGSVELMSSEQHNMTECVMHRSYHQALGVLRNSPPISPMGPNPDAFGHHGVGGSIGLADRKLRVGFAYAMNRMHGRMDNGPRAGRLKDATFASLN